MPVRKYLERPHLARFPFVFIVTYGRSGSTLLQAILNAIPGYCIRGENYSALFYLFVAGQHIEEAHRKFGRKYTDPSASWFGADRLDPGRFSLGLADVFLDECLKPSVDARCVGFKEIRHLQPDIPDELFPRYLDFIQTAFPGAALIFNVRDIANTANSGWWRDRDFKTLQKQLSSAIERFESYAERRSNCFLFSYDLLTARPEYCENLFDFLGEPFDQASLEELLARRHGFATPLQKKDNTQSSHMCLGDGVSLSIEAGRIANLRRRIEEMTSQVGGLRRELSSSDKALSEARRDMKRVRRECSELTKSLSAMRNSTSWRLTSPLRRMRLMQQYWLTKKT